MKKTIESLKVFATIIYLPIYFFGRVLYALTRILQGLAYFIMLDKYSAREEFKNFSRKSLNIEDAF